MLIRFLCLFALVLPSCANAATITLRPGVNIQEAVDVAPEGGLFILEPGVYRQQSIMPKDGQRFIGKNGAILNGAMLLTSWQKEGRYWIQRDLPAPRRPHGFCRDRTDLCTYREDLFLAGILYHRVATLEDLGPGKWFYLGGAAYLVDDPTGRTVELSVVPFAIGGDAKGIVLKNLVVEKYASAAQRGAIDARDGRDWQVVAVTARWNHGIGIFIGDGISVQGGSYSHNGQMGMGGQGDGALIEDVEISYNNYAGFSSGWEAGGTKFVMSNGLKIRGTCVHHNDGPGLWTDIDNINILIEDNKVYENSGDGIKHEISYDAVIRNNTVARNGSRKDNWLWGSQILIQNSANVEVYRNIVEVDAEFGNGISIIHQNRHTGKYGPLVAANNTVHHNEIIHLGKRGKDGMVADFDGAWFWRDGNNQFTWNNYVIVDPKHVFWAFNNRLLTWSSIRDNGLEQHGTLTIERRQPMELSCG